MRIVCPKCGGSLLVEKQEDGTLAAICIMGHRFEPQLPSTMPSGPSEPSYEEIRAELKATREDRDRDIAELVESGVPIEKVAKEYKLKKSSVESICYRQKQKVMA